MLYLTCSCGHKALLPETSGRFTCSQCKQAHELNWFDGPEPPRGSGPSKRADKPSAFDQWMLWRLRTGRVAGANHPPKPVVEFIPEAAGQERRGSAA